MRINRQNGAREDVPGIARLIVETEFGTTYKRSGLDPKTRKIGIDRLQRRHWETAGIGAVRRHIPTALKAGATRIEILEILVQIGFGAGLPTSIGALQAVAEVF